jgi:anti-sigma B factor antagonist
MDLQERSAGAVTLIDVSGKLQAGDDSGRLKDKINSLLHQSRKQIVLNLAGVPYIDSTGLGELVATHATVTRQGGQIVLVQLTARVQDLLAICRLLTVFDTFDTEAEALKILQPL